jgi:hypothetical protein
MHIRHTMWRIIRVLLLCIAVSALAFLTHRSVPLQSAALSPPMQFREAAPQGFGDRQNSGTWSMLWWKDKLYVGTVRSWYCWSQAALHRLAPLLIPYPPTGPDFDCAPDARDLPLQAEIWRYSPETDLWERVYQAPNDVEIPDSPGRYTTRDVGYRDMIVFEESDGTEALYVCGVTVNSVWSPLPPPRILRSTDGVTFVPIPQDPGTILGDLGQDQSTFRDFEIYNGRLYVINGKVQGHGSVLEAEDPASGNDSFRWVLSQDVRVFEMAPYNGYLYLGLADRLNGYAVVKTNATGTPPYALTPVVTNGGFLEPVHSPSVVSMHVFGDRLYVGTDQPAELIRINPDDSWDLLVGTPRETPEGWKYPFSGLDAGFEWPTTAHIWRMQAHAGALYIGTNDATSEWGQILPALDEPIGWQYGFDLYETTDGYYFRPVTVNGFGDKYQTGLRGFASTPYGLFVGTVSLWYGLRVWQGADFEPYIVYLPLVDDSSGGPAWPAQSTSGVPITRTSTLAISYPSPPGRLEAERTAGGVVLSWEPSPDAVRFRIFRSDPVSIPALDPDAWFSRPFAEIGTTDGFFYVDPTPVATKPYRYRVLAQNAMGLTSSPSSLARVPSLTPVATFASLNETLEGWRDTGSSETGIAAALQEAHENVLAGDLDGAAQRLEQLRQAIAQGLHPELTSWRSGDFGILLDKLVRRIRLAQVGLIGIGALD